MRRLVALLLLSAVLLTGCTREHYALHGDYSIGFTNTDVIVVSIREALRTRAAKIHIRYDSHTDNMDDIAAVVRELMQCAAAETARPDEGDYLRYQYGGYETQYAYTLTDGLYHYEITVVPDYYTTAAQEAKVDDRVAQVITELHLSGLNEYERIRAVCDYVEGHVQYDQVHKKHPTYHLRSTAYGALVNSRATCQGYAVLTYRLLREAGVQTRIVTGMAVSPDGAREPHAWNIAAVDGVYYNLDLTWHDTALRCDADFAGHERDAAFLTEAFLQTYPMAQTSYALTEKE